jgi:hypothetical protein
MLVRKFKLRRNHDKDSFPWSAESEIDRYGSYRGFHAVGKMLSDVIDIQAAVGGNSRHFDTIETIEIGLFSMGF